MRRRARFDATRFPRRLNLGCGTDRRDGYVNVDFNAFYKPDLVADVRDLGMLPSAYYEEIVAQDVLEHLPRAATPRALREWNRLLVPGGSLELRVPSIEALMQLFAESGTFARHEELAQCLFGTQAYDGDYHHAGFTKVLLEGYLERAGFRVDRLSLRDAWLFDVTARKTGNALDALDAQRSTLLRIDDHERFLDQAYALLLRRPPDEEGRSFFTKALRTGELGRSEVIAIIEGSPEFRALHRDPG